MQKKVLLLLLLAAVVVILVAALADKQHVEDSGGSNLSDKVVESGSVSVNYPAPVFTLPDLAGDAIKLDGFLEKVVIVNFWATWCASCKQEMSVLDEYGLQHPDSVTIIGIAVEDTPESVRSFLEETPVSYTILIDENGIVGAAYHVAGYPMTYFIDAAGIIRGKYLGILTPRVLQQNLAPLGIRQ